MAWCDLSVMDKPVAAETRPFSMAEFGLQRSEVLGREVFILAETGKAAPGAEQQQGGSKVHSPNQASVQTKAQPDSIRSLMALDQALRTATQLTGPVEERRAAREQLRQCVFESGSGRSNVVVLRLTAYLVELDQKTAPAGAPAALNPDERDALLVEREETLDVLTAVAPNSPAVQARIRARGILQTAPRP